MTERLLGLTGSLLAADSRPRVWRLIRTSAVGCVAVFLIGCGGQDSTTTSTSNQDIAAFIEENPEFGNSPPTSAGSSQSSDSTALGLER